MKNRRDVCRATNAGYLEYSGLPGRVKARCQNTPLTKSPYCQLHAPLLATPAQPTEAGPPDSVQDAVAGLIVTKRSTRGSTVYRVCTCKCSVYFYKYTYFGNLIIVLHH